MILLFLWHSYQIDFLNLQFSNEGKPPLKFSQFVLQKNSFLPVGKEWFIVTFPPVVLHFPSGVMVITWQTFFIFKDDNHDLPDDSNGKDGAHNRGGLCFIPGQEDLLEREMAAHSSILAWKIPCTEEPSKLYSIGSQKRQLCLIN